MSAEPVHTSARSASMRGTLPWVVADQAVFSASSLVLAISVARDTTPAQFGAFGIAYMVYTVLLGAVLAFTAEVVMVRGATRSPRDLHRMLRDASGTAVVAGLGCTIAAGLLAILDNGGASTAVAMLVPAPLLFLQAVWRLAFVALARPLAALGNDLVWATLLVVGLVLTPSFGTDRATAIVWVWSGAGALCGVLAALQARCQPNLSAAWRWTLTHGRAGWRYAGEFLAVYGAAQGVLISVGLFAGLAESGGYRGAQLLFGPVQVALNALRIAAMPFFAKARAAGNGHLLWRRGLMAGVAATFVVLLWGGAIIALPDTVGRQLLGSSWSLTHGILLPMLCAQAMTAFGLGALLLLRTGEALQSTFNRRVAGGVATFGLGTVGAGVYGGVAASAGVACGATLLTAALWRQAHVIRYRSMEPITAEGC